MKIGVISDSFRVGFKEAVLKAAAVGAQGIQTYATKGEFSVETLDTAQKRRDTLRYVKDNGLVFSALCGDF
ncbi:MAG: sugar phosphate isomerase/epimerase, partial [Clostridia bacterium]|nr:sugar phosphate isomerase/epimerase [Clostridia bacterium]